MSSSSAQQKDAFQEVIEKIEKERAALIKKFDEFIEILKKETERLKQQVSRA